MTWLIVGGYVVLGIVTICIMGALNLFDYTPESHEISPNILKYVMFFVWPIMAFHALMYALACLNEKVNKFLGVRS
jgi:hypothetical protein